MNKLTLISIVIIVLSFVIGIISYQYLPDKIASHWDSQGQVNGYMYKFFGVFLLPLILIGLFLLFYLLPKIDPLKENYKKFKRYYDSFVLILVLFIFYIYMQTIVWNFGTKFNMNLSLIPALGFLFIYIGIVLKKVKRNWFIGIRTPWTISNDKVWDKTRKLGSRLFILSGIITLLGIFFPNYMIVFILVPVIVSSIISIIYSYLEYRKEK
jgi:uncharacterized membrane protein